MTLLSDKETEYLQTMGLSRHGIDVFELLTAAQKAITVAEIAKELSVLPSAVYRICYELENGGLVHRSGSRPVKFRAISKAEAYKQYYQQKKRTFEQQLAQLVPLGENTNNDTQTVFGRQALYETYISLATQAETEVAVYAIGIAYTTALYKTQAALVKKGVRVRHIIQELQPSNYHVAHKWQKIGVKLRLLKSNRGFHMSLIDNRSALITFSNPADTDERLTIVTHNPAAVAVMARLYEQMWQEARQIDL